jgi:hypothetical protein
VNDAPATPFSFLLTRQRSRQQRERLHELRDKCGLTDDDALWGFVAVVEAYCDELQSRANVPPSAAESPTTTVRWLFLSLGAAAQTAALALAYAVGQGAASAAPRPSWWSVPAGWVVFVLAVPALALVASAGWRARQSDPWLGWGLIALGLIASVASLGALLTSTL